jgi:hypothetical protein
MRPGGRANGPDPVIHGGSENFFGLHVGGIDTHLTCVRSLNSGLCGSVIRLHIVDRIVCDV